MIRRHILKGFLAMTIPGMGGQTPPRADQQYSGQQGVPVAPGSNSKVLRVTEIIITPGGFLQGIFTYSSSPPAAGTLVESSNVATAGTDPYGNIYLAGNSTYAATFATSVQAGFIAFYSGSLAGGWTLQGSVSGDVAGNVQVNAPGQLQLLGSVGVTINGSANTGSGNNGGVTSGPSGTVNAFPAAGPNHTHAEVHQHPL